MSLINDALKKAQKLQLQGQSQSMGSTSSPQAGSGQTPPPPNPGGAPGAPSLPSSSGHDRSMPGQLFMLLAFGAGALIAVSVLVTVYLLRQPAAPSPPSAAAPAAPEKPAPALSSSNGFAPVIKAPPPTLSSPAVSLSNGSAPAENSAPIPAPAAEKFPTTTTAPATAVTPPEPSFMPPPPALPVLRSLGEGGSSSNGPDSSKPDPKILAYLDALQIAGIRVSDTGSKVLMNDRVFRETEIVDHLLGLRLKKVQSDTLTFVDERGVIYTKNF
jgi:hypothetical protein